ncbi:MAG: hypothetical protein WKG07_05840 [Hymenobacter sp.]
MVGGGVGGSGRHHPGQGERARWRGPTLRQRGVRGSATSTGSNEQGQYQLRRRAAPISWYFNT